jgi:hypothetical protein
MSSTSAIADKEQSSDEISTAENRVMVASYIAAADRRDDHKTTATTELPLPLDGTTMEKAKLKKQEISNGEASAAAATEPKRRRPKLLSVITRILAKRSPLAKSQSSPAKAQASFIQVPVGN